MEPTTPAHGNIAKACFESSDNSMDLISTNGTTSSPTAEPSPASTYGGSVTSSDVNVPATPGDNDSDDSDFDDQYNEDGGVFLGDMTTLSLGDEEQIHVKANASGKYCSSTAQKNSTGQGFSTSPAGYISPFVRAGLSKRGEDPFSKTPSSSGSTASEKRSMMSRHWRSTNSESSGSRRLDFTSSNVSSHVARPTGFNNPIVVTGKNAQAIYPPACCVFVANLCQAMPDASLEAAVTKTFREYGTVFVKIRRDHSNMPFAFCQYTNTDDAERALLHGKGRMIYGRDARTERAKAHRVYFMHMSPGVLTVDMARNRLRQFGKLSRCYVPSPTERASFGIDEKGVMVHFELYEDGVNAQAYFRNDSRYHLRSVAGMSPLSSKTEVKDSQAQAYIDSYEQDRRSIHIASMPVNVTEGILREYFGDHGEIVSVTIVNNASKVTGGDRYVWGFVEFDCVEAAQVARRVKNQTYLLGSLIRVSERNSERLVATKSHREAGNYAHSTPSRDPPPRVLDHSVQPESVPASLPPHQGALQASAACIPPTCSHMGYPAAGPYTCQWHGFPHPTQLPAEQHYVAQVAAHFAAYGQFPAAYGQYPPAYGHYPAGHPANPVAIHSGYYQPQPVAGGMNLGAAYLQSGQEHYHSPTHYQYGQPSNASIIHHGAGASPAAESDEDRSATPTAAEWSNAAQ